MANAEDTLIGSSGSLVAAGFETAGYYLQSRSLDSIANGYGLTLASFLFAIALISATVIHSVGGQYKFFRWLLICPGLFFFVMYYRIESSGVNWQFGASSHGGQSAQDMGDGVSDTSYTPKVSWIFARWNQFSSSLVQGFVQAVMSFKTENEREVEHLLAKVTKFGTILTLEVEDPDIAKFLSVVFFDKCGQYLGLHLQLLNANNVLKPEGVQEQITLIDSQPVMSSNDTEYQFVQKLIDRKYLDETTLPAAADAQGARDLRCSDLWLVSVNVLKRWGGQLATSIGDTQLSGLVAKFKRAGITDEEAKNEMLNTMAVSAILRMTQQVIPQMTNEGAKASRLQDLVMLDQDKSRGDSIYENVDTSRDMKILNASYEHQGKGQFLTTMLSLPYMQGFLLYFLAWMFPWFCFILLIPGRHLSFLHWFGLWFWVKTWDIGIAMVLVIEDLLFYLMPSGNAISDQNVTDMTAALKLALSSDPSHSVQLYYTIIASLLAAVPVLCGFLIKRGSGDALSALNQGFGQFSKQVGTSMASAVRALGMNQVTQGINQRLSSAYQETYQRESEKVMQNIEGWRNPSSFAQYLNTQIQSGKSPWLKGAIDSGQSMGQVQSMFIDRMYDVGMADAEATALEARWAMANSDEVVNMQAQTRMYKAFPQEFSQKDFYNAFNLRMRIRTITPWATPYQNTYSNWLADGTKARVDRENDAEKARKAAEPKEKKRRTSRRRWWHLWKEEE